MATAYFQSSMASSIPCSSSSSHSLKKRTFRTVCAANIRNSAKVPLPPVNPNDPFLARLASVMKNSPEKLYNRPANSDLPPYVDLFQSRSSNMTTPAQAERSVSYDRSRTRRPPPDLPSLLLNDRIVYIGMPLVPAVTELVIAQLLHLDYDNPEEPIYLYINSTGTTRDDGEIVGMESEGFAIYDALMRMKCEIRTVGLGHAIGHACLLLAAGTKGKRSMIPHARAVLQQPRMPSSGLVPASEVLLRTREAIINRDTLVKLVAKHTEHPVEYVAKVMSRPFFMSSVEAKEFGVVDKILWRGQEDLMRDTAPPEAWDTTYEVHT